MEMGDPTLKRTSVVLKYTASDGYRLEFSAKGGTGSKNQSTGDEVAPERAMLAGLVELSRLLCLFGFEQEAQDAFENARQAVADWRKERAASSSEGKGVGNG
jgi:hypothetical protein